MPQLDETSAQNLTETIQRIFPFKRKKHIEIVQDVIKIIDLDRDDHKELELHESAKILIIDHCNTLQQFLDTVGAERFKNFMKNSSHCFIVIANIRKLGHVDPQDFISSFDIDDLVARPYVFQLNIASLLDCSKIFFKNHGENELKSFTESKISKEVFKKELRLEKTLNLDLLLRALMSGIGGSFDGNILSAKIDFTKKFHDTSLINYAIRGDDELVVRFLKLFSSEVISKESLEAAAMQLL